MQDTLSFHKKRPFTSNLDLSQSELKLVVGRYNNFKTMLPTKGQQVKVYPEGEAIQFYLSNHAMSIISQRIDPEEPLGVFEDWVRAYHQDMSIKGLRMFYYLLLICTRESRHAHSGGGLDDLYVKYPKIKKFHSKHIKDTGGSESIQQMLTYCPDVSLGLYSDFLVDAFEMCSYSGGYGGSAWADVAKPLREFCHGKITAEMLLDTAFTLCHNNGPIFNKGMLFNGYDSHEIVKILDVQRSGQIPQLVSSGATHFVSDNDRDYQKSFESLVGGSFGGEVDWFKVEELGAMKTYPKEKQEQEAKNGIPKKSEAEIKLEQMKKNQVDAEELKKKKDFEKHNLEIMPGVFVKKISRGEL